MEAVAPEKPVEKEEFELVLGKRQAAALSFVGLVLLAVAAGGAYLIGKAAIRPEPSPKVVMAAPPVQPPAPVVQAAPAPAAKPPEPPLFADPVAGAIYIQMGAVERGIAVVFAEGLRKRGLDGFVAPGPNEKIFRVVIGPFKTEGDYQ